MRLPDPPRATMRSPEVPARGPERVEVPTPVETIFPPVRRRSPAEEVKPREEESPAAETPPVKVEVPAPPEMIFPEEMRRSPDEMTAPLEKEGETAVVDPKRAPIPEAEIEPPVTVMPDTVESPPLVEMEMPPV